MSYLTYIHCALRSFSILLKFFYFSNIVLIFIVLTINILFIIMRRVIRLMIIHNSSIKRSDNQKIDNEAYQLF